MRHRAKVAAGAVAIIACLCSTSCSSSGTKQSSGASGAGSTAASGQTAPPDLSLKTVKVAGLEGSVNWLSVWTAEEKGFYAKRGLSVDFVNTDASAASMIAAAIGGSYQFIAANPVGLPAAIQNGADVKTVFVPDVGATDDLAISTKAADAHHIPSSGTTAQLSALKGSHLNVAVVSITAGSYLDLLAVLKGQGITASTSAGSDIKIVSVGSLTNETAALQTGQVDGILNIYPNTEVPNTIHVRFGDVAPVSNDPPLIFTTSSSLIKSHPDTVQAFVSASVEGWQYTRDHPDEAEQVADKIFPTVGITDPARIKELFQLDQQYRSKTPAVTGGDFNAIATVLQTGGQPTTITYDQFADSSFANKAITDLKINAPLGTASN